MPLESKLLVYTVKLKHQVFLTVLVSWGTGPVFGGFVQKPEILNGNYVLKRQRVVNGRVTQACFLRTLLWLPSILFANMTSSV